MSVSFLVTREHTKFEPILVLLLRQYGENYLREEKKEEDTGYLWREIGIRVGETSARKAAIFPMLLTFPGEAPLWKVLANHKSHAHWPFLAKKKIYIFMHSYDLTKAMLNTRET